jgi:hypothetical protein
MGGPGGLFGGLGGTTVTGLIVLLIFLLLVYDGPAVTLP